jgi:hypothetical protein
MDLKQKYQEYLKSDDWRQKRTAKLARAKYRCAICGDGKKLHVHHLIYRQWFNVRMSDLRVLCERCHGVSHELMDLGQIIFAPSMGHQERFAATKLAVQVSLGVKTAKSKPEPWSSMPVKPFTVTKEWLTLHATPAGGWTRRQTMALGIDSWPPPKKWHKRIVGTAITEDQRRAFIAGRREPVQESEDDKLLAWFAWGSGELAT